MSLTRVNYYVKKIATGYLIEYYLNGIETAHAFDTWKEALNFLKDNPPKFLREEIPPMEYVEIEDFV